MAPEVVSSQLYGKPVDVWAAGILLHVLLVGYLPFTGTRERLFEAICRGRLRVSTYTNLRKIINTIHYSAVQVLVLQELNKEALGNNELF